jgi:hypothetical protein
MRQDVDDRIADADHVDDFRHEKSVPPPEKRAEYSQGSGIRDQESEEARA